LIPEGWGRSILDFGLECAREPIEEVDATLPGCASDGQHSFHESAAAFTVGTEGYFPPEHNLADGEFGVVVGGHLRVISSRSDWCHRWKARSLAFLKTS
jgi:hypothetical protein